MFNVGATVFRVNEPVVVENTSDFGFDTYQFFTSSDLNLFLLTDSVASGQSFTYTYDTPGKKILSLYARKTDGSILLHTATKSVTFSVGYFPSATLTYEIRTDQLVNPSKNYVVYGVTFEFIRSPVGPEDSFGKTYAWNYDGGVCGSAAGATLQKLTYSSYGIKTVGLTVDSMFGTTFASIKFHSIGTPIVGITSTSPFGVINDNTSMTLSAYIVAGNEHGINDINYNWNVFGTDYSGVSFAVIARQGYPNSNVVLNYSSKILSGLSGTTSQSYTINTTPDPISNTPVPLYVDFSQMIGFGDSEYGVASGYSSASDYEARLIAAGCTDCRWISARTYQATINAFNSLPATKRNCINLNVEIPWLYILNNKYNGAISGYKWESAVIQEWERMYGQGLPDPLFGVEPVSGQNWYNVDAIGLKNAAIRLYTEIVDYVKSNGASRVIHYLYPSDNIADGYYGSQIGIPMSGYRGVIFPKGVCHSYWNYVNTSDSFFTYQMNPFLSTLVFGNHLAIPQANSNADSYGFGAYNYFPNLSNPGITHWRSVYGYNIRKNVNGGGETYQYELEDLKYWTKVSHGNLVQRSRNILHQYGVTHADISPVVWPTMFAPHKNVGTARGLNNWNEDSQGITLMADIIVDGFFGDRDIDSMELFDPYSRPNSITVWTPSSYYKGVFVNLNIECLDPGCNNCPSSYSTDVKVTRSILEKVLFGRPQFGVDGVSGTVGNEPIGYGSQSDHLNWYFNNNLGNTFWAGNNWLETSPCQGTPNQTIWWTPTEGSTLPDPCSIGPGSVLAPWLNFDNPITTQHVRRAIRHWVTDQNIKFAERLRYKLNLAKPKKIIPMYGDWKLFVGWNSTELADPTIATIVEPYKQRILNVLTPNSYIGVATFGNIQTQLALLSSEERKNMLLDIKFPWVAIAYDTMTGSTAPHMSGSYYDRVRSEWLRQKGTITGFAGATIGDLKDLTATLMKDCVAWGLTNGCENIAVYQRAVGLNGLSGYGTEEKGAGIPFAGLRGNSYAPSNLDYYLGGNTYNTIGYTSEYSYWKARTNSTDENMTVTEYVDLELAQKRYDVFIRGLSAAGRWMIPMYNFYPNVGKPEAVEKWRTMYPVERISPDGTVQENPFDIDDLNYWTEKNFAKVVTEFRRGLVAAGATTGIPKVAVLMNLAGTGFDLAANGHDAVNPVPKTFMKLNHWAFMKDLQKAAELEIKGLFSHCDINFPYFTYPDEVWFWDYVSYYCVTLPSLNFEALSLTTQYNTALQCAVARNALEKKLFNRPYPQEGEPIGYSFDEYFGMTLGITLHDNWFFANNLGTSFWRIPTGTSGITWWDLQTGSLLPTPCSIDPISGPLSPWLPQGTTLNTSHIHFALKHYLSEEYCSALEKAKATMNQMLGY